MCSDVEFEDSVRVRGVSKGGWERECVVERGNWT